MIVKGKITQREYITRALTLDDIHFIVAKSQLAGKQQILTLQRCTNLTEKEVLNLHPLEADQLYHAIISEYADQLVAYAIKEDARTRMENTFTD